MKYLFPLGLLLFGAVTQVSAQVTSPTNPSGYAQNRATAPLSPYLNLLRGGNNAVNYYYGVRPGSQPGSTGMFNQGNVGQRQTFFPYFDNLSELADEPRDVNRVAPTGHPAGFFNTLGYFPTAMAPRGQGQQQQTGRRR